MAESFRLIDEGDVFYARALRAIRNAREHIQFMFYIWTDDAVGKVFSRALVRKAKQGVKVTLVVDAIGSHKLSTPAIRRLRKGGVEVFIHNRPHIFRWNWLRYLIRRNHRKIILIDNKKAFTGGFNIMRECSTKHYGANRWLDLMVETESLGLVAALQDQFEDACRRARHTKWSTRLLTRSGNRAILFRGSKTAPTYSMSRYLKRKLRTAKKQIVICVPYFIPYGFFWRILARKLKQGLSVEVILSKKSDLPWIDAVSFLMAYSLQKRGATVWLFDGGINPPRFSHTKLFRIDDMFVTGSANYDYRSMVLNLDTLLAFEKKHADWESLVLRIKKLSRVALAQELKPTLRAWLLWPFRWLL